MPLNAAIFTKVANYRRHQVNTVRIELQQNRSQNTEGRAETHAPVSSPAYSTFHQERICRIL